MYQREGVSYPQIINSLSMLGFHSPSIVSLQRQQVHTFCDAKVSHPTNKNRPSVHIGQLSNHYQRWAFVYEKKRVERNSSIFPRNKRRNYGRSDDSAL